MEIKFDESIKRLVREVPWCVNAGKGGENECFTLIGGAKEANTALKSVAWEEITLEASNEMSAFLEQNFACGAGVWNALASEARGFLNAEILPNLPVINGIEAQALAHDIGWNVLHFMIQTHYKKFLKNRDFFARVFEIYRAGRIAVGYDAQSGKFLVY